MWQHHEGERAKDGFLVDIFTITFHRTCCTSLTGRKKGIHRKSFTTRQRRPQATKEFSIMSPMVFVMGFGGWYERKRSTRRHDELFWVIESWFLNKKVNFFATPQQQIIEYLIKDISDSLTFFSDSIHLVMAGTLEPVRSLSAVMASLITKIVDMVSL